MHGLWLDLEVKIRIEKHREKVLRCDNLLLKKKKQFVKSVPPTVKKRSRIFIFILAEKLNPSFFFNHPTIQPLYLQKLNYRWSLTLKVGYKLYITAERMN